MNRKFDDSKPKGSFLEEYRKKIIVAEKVREFDHILQKMNELDVLKTILLNEYQKASLDFLQKPKDTNMQIFKKFHTSRDAQSGNLESVENYFLNLFREEDGNLNDKDEYLFHQLDEKIKQNIIGKSLKIKN